MPRNPDTLPLFDVVMAAIVPTLDAGADAQREALEASRFCLDNRHANPCPLPCPACEEECDPACMGDGACPECGDVDPGPYDHTDPCRACGFGPEA